MVVAGGLALILRSRTHLCAVAALNQFARHSTSGSAVPTIVLRPLSRRRHASSLSSAPVNANLADVRASLTQCATANIDLLGGGPPRTTVAVGGIGIGYEGGRVRRRIARFATHKRASATIYASVCVCYYKATPHAPRTARTRFMFILRESERRRGRIELP